MSYHPGCSSFCLDPTLPPQHRNCHPFSKGIAFFEMISVIIMCQICLTGMVSWKRNVRETCVDLSVQFDFVKTVQSDLDKTWNLGRNFSQSPNHFAHFDDIHKYRILTEYYWVLLSKPCVKSRKSLISVNLLWLRSYDKSLNAMQNSHNNVKLQWVILIHKQEPRNSCMCIVNVRNICATENTTL